MTKCHSPCSTLSFYVSDLTATSTLLRELRCLWKRLEGKAREHHRMKRVIYLCACLFIFSVTARVVEEWDMAGGGPWGMVGWGGVGGGLDLWARMLVWMLQWERAASCLSSHNKAHLKTAKRWRERAVDCVMQFKCKCLNGHCTAWRVQMGCIVR